MAGGAGMSPGMAGGLAGAPGAGSMPGPAAAQGMQAQMQQQHPQVPTTFNSCYN